MSYTREDLVDFLKAMDSEMSRSANLIIIGGASLSLAYNFSNTTVDMDLISKISAELKEAIQKAKTSTQIDIHVSTTYVYADIMHMEDRFQTPPDLGVLKKLKISVPEKHDLALMKAARSEARDLSDIVGLHRADELNADILFNRFKKELLPLHSGDDSLLKERFLGMIETLFGEEVADEFEAKMDLNS